MTHHSVRVIAVKFGVELGRAGHVVLLVAIRHRKNRKLRMERCQAVIAFCVPNVSAVK